jgi:8-oxo-dGTP diphosphatase
MKIRATVVCEQNRHVLLVRKPKRPWTLPGGKLKRDETNAEAAIRELNEETGLVVDTLLYLMVWSGDGAQHHVFEASVLNLEEARPQNEICDCIWQPLDAVHALKISNATLMILKSFQRRL